MSDFINLQFTVDSHKQYSEDQLLDLLVSKLEQLRNISALKGDINDVLLGYDFDEVDQGYIYAELEPGSLIDGSDLNSVGGSLINNPTTFSEKAFSTSSIADKMKMIGMSPTSQMKMLVADYSKFFNQNESALMNNQNKLNDFISLFLSDMMGLFNTLMPELKSGADLSSMLGIKNISPKLINLSKDLGKAYRKALSSEESSGSLSSSVLGELKDLYSQFMNELIMTIFFGEGAVEDVNLSNNRRIPFSI